MPRLREVPRAEVESDVVNSAYDRLFGPGRDPVADPGTAAGTPGDWWTVFALVPDVMQHSVLGFRLYGNPARKLPPELRELGQLRGGWLRGSQFVFSQHCKSVRFLGFSEEKIEAIKSWQVSDLFSPVERALLAYTDALVGDGGRVADGIFVALKEHLSDEQILEFTYITCMYEMHATMSRALKLEWDNREDPIVEIAAPEGFGGFNLSAQISVSESSTER
jgi:alkylhydroperoxidase family enzyme